MILPLLPAQTADAPHGFAPADELGVLRRNPNDPQAPDWELSLDGDHLVVETAAAHYRRTQREAVKRSGAGGFVFPRQMMRVTWHLGDGVKVDDGWLYGFDQGEFAGGLWWFSTDGRQHRAISGDNTKLVLRTDKGVFAVQGLNHLMFWYGRLVSIEKSRGKWATRTVTDLHVSPEVVADGSRFIFATGHYVSTLETDGRQREIYRSRGYEFRVESMVRRAKGEVWIGSSHGLLRLRPKPGGDYTAQWFLPLK